MIRRSLTDGRRTRLTSQPTETELANDGSTRSRDLDGGGGACRHGARLGLCVVPVNNTEHVGHQTNGEDVVGIGEETDTSDENGADVVPSKGSLVDLGERETATLVRVDDMSVAVGCRVSDLLIDVLTDRHQSTHSLWKLWKAALPPVVRVVIVRRVTGRGVAVGGGDLRSHAGN